MMTVDVSLLQSGDSGRTKDFQYVRGEYAIGGELVPYFAITMSITEALQHLSLASTLAVDPEDPVNIDELIQRDVKRSRAEGEIVNYLKEPGRLKFFNSFTVVLMPLDEHKRPTRKFGAAPDGGEQKVHEGGFEVTRAGSVRIRQVPRQSFGFLSWLTDSAAAVIIDGQHRFMALKAVNDELHQHLRPSQTTIPVLVLVLDEQAGFKGANDEPGDVVKASRAIFTDINKYAVKVSAEREYLLDDLSLKAVSMRHLITSGIGKSTSGVVNAATRVPLALVDWAGSRQVKFEDGPYISSVQAMHTLVSGLLGSDISTEPDPSVHEDMLNWVETIYARLRIDDQRWNHTEILERIQVAESEAMPFRLNSNELGAAAQAFASGLGQTCVQFFLRASPYRKLIDGYLSAGFLGGEEEYWLGQGEGARLGWVAQFGRDPGPVAAAIYKDVKAAYHYAYLVVFQRAFVLVGGDFLQVHEEILSGWGFDVEEMDSPQDAFIDAWIDKFNEVIAPLLSHANEDFWLGTAVRAADRGIDYGVRGLASVSGLTKLLLIPGDEVSSIEVEDVKLLAGDPNDEVLGLLDADHYRVEGPDKSQVEWVGRWRAMHDSIGRGRAPGGEFGKVRRTAAKQYRDGLRRHVLQVAAATGRQLTDDQRDRLVLAFGARRLAHVLADDA